MSWKRRSLTGLACLAFAAYLLYTSLSLDRFTCEVCVEFGGQTVCRTASGATREEAQRTAVEAACAILAPGRTEGMACSRSTPVSVDFRE